MFVIIGIVVVFREEREAKIDSTDLLTHPTGQRSPRDTLFNLFVFI